MDGTIGFIGLGNMGGNMARNLARAHHRLLVYDVQPAAVETLSALDGVRGAGSVGEVAAEAAVLFTVLPNDEIVRRTYLEPGGIAAHGRAGLVTCDCSTVSPAVTQQVHAALARKGIQHMDTPMLGSKPQAVSGEIFFIVAGDEAQLPTIAPLLDAMGKQHLYVGPVSTANRIKLIHNVLGAANSVAVAESLALCVKAGVDPEVFRQVVIEGRGMAYTTYFGKRVERVLGGDFSPQFSLELMHKDVSLAMQLARASGTAVPIMEQTLQAYSEGLEGGWRGEDFSAVTHVIERKIGRPIARAVPRATRPTPAPRPASPRPAAARLAPPRPAAPRPAAPVKPQIPEASATRTAKPAAKRAATPAARPAAKRAANSAGRKPAAAKPAPKRSAAKKATAREPAVRKVAARRAVAAAKRTATRKSVARKPAARKAASRQTTARKTAVRKAAVHKAAVRKAAVRKAAVRKAEPRKTAGKRAVSSKLVLRKAVARRAAPKAAAKRGATRKSIARKSAAGGGPTRRTPTRRTTPRGAPARRKR